MGSGTDEVYDSSPHNLFPLVIEALLEGRTPRINGDDYPTPDGTCVRDYVHVPGPRGVPRRRGERPRARAGARARSTTSAAATACRCARSWTPWRGCTGIDFTPEIHPRRPGDPARIVASGDAAAAELDWKMRHTIDEMAASAWSARRAHLEPAVTMARAHQA